MTAHECPAAGCDRKIGYGLLMCRSHWYMVPKSIRDTVWKAWEHGEGAGTPGHSAAIRAAIKSVNDRLAAKGVTSAPGGAP